jgi:nicotinamide mononucleotide adenylyltransferase
MIQPPTDPFANMKGKKYACYIGRWQTWHPGHEWLINQQLKFGKNVLIMIRDMVQDENNPKTSMQILTELYSVYEDLIKEERVALMIIPDIESFNYGRKVGYDVIEHVPPEDIGDISGTKIRGGHMNVTKSKEREGLWSDKEEKNEN